MTDLRTALDWDMLHPVDLDSAALTQLSAVAHEFREVGLYSGSTMVDGGRAAQFELAVEEEGPAEAIVDLAAVQGLSGEGACWDPPRRCHVRAGGLVLFHVGSGRARHAVVVTRPTRMDDDVVFDSRRLMPGDFFTAVLLRPGRYSLENTEGTGGRGEIDVAFPTHRRDEWPLDPVRLESAEGGFGPQLVRVESGQGHVYHCRMPTRIRIILVNAHDEPSIAAPNEGVP